MRWLGFLVVAIGCAGGSSSDIDNTPATDSSVGDTSRDSRAETTAETATIVDSSVVETSADSSTDTAKDSAIVDTTVVDTAVIDSGTAIDTAPVDTSTCDLSKCSFVNATAKCVGDKCAMDACKSGWADCDKDGLSCETAISIELANCGACGNKCTLADATSACIDGKCTIASCSPGYDDCDKDPKNGCEANLKTDPKNCGGCGKMPAETCNLADDDCNGKCDDVAGCRTGVYRTYKSSTGEHFYTTSASEGPGAGFTVEYANYYYLYSASTPGLVPFYRCWVAGVSKHFYTQSSTCEGQTVESVMGYIAPSALCGAIPLYRLVHGTNGDHFYTIDSTERSSALSGGYIDEGIAGYVWAASSG